MLKNLNIFRSPSQLTNILKDHGRIGISGEFDIEVLLQEDVTRSYGAPGKPTEAGYEIVDNVTKKPLQLRIQISSNAWNWRNQRKSLENLADSRKRIQYYSPIDKTLYTDLIITNLSISARREQSRGFTANLQLKKSEVIVAEKATLETTKDHKGQKVQSEPEKTVIETPVKQDITTGKGFGSDGILYKITGGGGSF